MNDTIETLKARIAELEASDAHNERRWRNEEAAKRQVMGYRDEWRDRAEAAETRLANLSAPAEVVDPSEVLRRAEQIEGFRGLPVHVVAVQRAAIDRVLGRQLAAAPALARALIAARAEADKFSRLYSALLCGTGAQDFPVDAAEIARVAAEHPIGQRPESVRDWLALQAEPASREMARMRAGLEDADEELAALRAEVERVGAAVEDEAMRSSNAYAEGLADGQALASDDADEAWKTLEAERDAARAEVEEARLTLAAEQGKPEGAPSEGWTCPPGTVYWQRRSESPLGTWAITPTSPQEREGHPGWRWRATFIDLDGRRSLLHESTARAAMLAADKAQG